MTVIPFVSNYGTNTTVNTIDINNFITGASTSPTPDTGSYARWQKIGSFVRIDYKYKFLNRLGLDSTTILFS
jgi:hypothetical protein